MLASAAVRALPASILALADVRCVPALRPEDLIELPASQRVVIVDAVVGPEPGELVRIDLDALAQARVAMPPSSSHQLPMPMVVGLAESIGSHHDGVFLGLAGSSFELGAPISQPVLRGLATLGAAICEEVQRFDEADRLRT
jgi:hydrogenase maturation protease